MDPGLCNHSTLPPPPPCVSMSPRLRLLIAPASARSFDACLPESSSAASIRLEPHDEVPLPPAVFPDVVIPSTRLGSAPNARCEGSCVSSCCLQAVNDSSTPDANDAVGLLRPSTCCQILPKRWRQGNSAPSLQSCLAEGHDQSDVSSWEALAPAPLDDFRQDASGAADSAFNNRIPTVLSDGRHGANGECFPHGVAVPLVEPHDDVPVPPEVFLEVAIPSTRPGGATDDRCEGNYVASSCPQTIHDESDAENFPLRKEMPTVHADSRLADGVRFPDSTTATPQLASPLPTEIIDDEFKANHAWVRIVTPLEEFPASSYAYVPAELLVVYSDEEDDFGTDDAQIGARRLCPWTPTYMFSSKVKKAGKSPDQTTRLVQQTKVDNTASPRSKIKEAKAVVANGDAIQRHVSFAPSSAHSVHRSEFSVQPYGEIYGTHPKNFFFDRNGKMRLVVRAAARMPQALTAGRTVVTRHAFADLPGNSPRRVTLLDKKPSCCE